MAKGEEETGVFRWPVKFLLGGSETVVELRVSCVCDCALCQGGGRGREGGGRGARRRRHGFVCVYQNTHLIIPRIAVGAESGYAAARLFRA